MVNLNEMRDDNPLKMPELGKWEFWKVDTRYTPHKYYKDDMLEALRITPKNQLVIRYKEEHAYSTTKLMYVPFEHWNSSSSPIWFRTNRKHYGWFIRPKHEPLITREALALISLILQERSN